MQSFGEVKECAHCRGTGFCAATGGSCWECTSATGSDKRQSDVMCSACKFKGSVWIGPWSGASSNSWQHL